MAYVRLKNRNKQYAKGKVTVVTPTYKRLKPLAEAIESVQRQTYSNWEHIVVSDGYDGEARDLIRQTNDSRVHYYYTSHMNIMGNYQRNFALNYATGEFLIYLDDDNILYANALSSMVSGFSSNDIGYVIGPILYGKNIVNPKYPFKWGKIDLLNYMLRRDIVERVWGQSMHACADFYLIEKISGISLGNYVDELIGHHR